MKLRFALNVVAAISLTLTTGSFAAETAKPKKEPATAAPDATKHAPTASAASTARSIPMYSRVDSIDVANKTFTTKRKKDGVEVKHVLSATAPVLKADGTAAKFSDIKVGDWVSGSRLKKSETEYEVVKVSKFGPPTTKKEGKKE